MVDVDEDVDVFNTLTFRPQQTCSEYWSSASAVCCIVETSKMRNSEESTEKEIVLFMTNSLIKTPHIQNTEMDFGNVENST